MKLTYCIVDSCDILDKTNCSPPQQGGQLPQATVLRRTKTYLVHRESWNYTWAGKKHFVVFFMCCSSSFFRAAVAAPRRPGPGVRVRPRSQQPQPHQGVPRLHRGQGIPARHSTGVRKHTQEVRENQDLILKKFYGPRNLSQRKVVFVK